MDRAEARKRIAAIEAELHEIHDGLDDERSASDLMLAESCCRRCGKQLEEEA